MKKCEIFALQYVYKVEVSNMQRRKSEHNYMNSTEQQESKSDQNFPFT